ncbi:MAG: hypothetical protein KatS3mg108_3286 [Isosphaeraceae bacterium]|jgi:uncharacterized protein (DUF58 family)|nr:MAG: hypothetical protein KatS3mg108_3286 [Isosphaeraceae bacterium]
MNGSARRLARLLRGRAAGVLAGAYASARPGLGLAFAELRPYVLGDDVRAIDWRATARQGRPIVRVYEAERSQPVWLVLDTSARLQAGVPGRTVGDWVREAALWLAAAAWLRGDRVGLVGAGVPGLFFRPGGGRRHRGRLARALDQVVFEARGVDLSEAVERLAKAPRRGLVFVLSDFRRLPDERAWRCMGRRHEVWPIRVVDRWEAEPPAAGLVAVVDPETGRRGWIDLGDDRVRTQIRERTSRLNDAFRDWCRRMGTRGAVVGAGDQVLSALERVLRAGQRGSRRVGRGRL